MEPNGPQLRDEHTRKLAYKLQNDDENHLVHPAGIADSIPMVRIGRFQLDPWNRSKRVQNSGGMYQHLRAEVLTACFWLESRAGNALHIWYDDDTTATIRRRDQEAKF